MEGLEIPNLEDKKESVRNQAGHEHLKAETLKLVRGFLESEERKIGAGLSAEVHYFGENNSACLKIISPETLKNDRKINSTIEEADFQEKAYSILENVDGINVPRPLFEYEFEIRNDTETIEEINVMCMERLNAVSVEDILDYKEELPEKFNFEDFFKKLKRGLTKLHEENLHHRDLRPGNVMIDLETGDPYLIDFGRSINTIGDEDPYLDVGIGGTTKHPKDEQGLREIRQLILKHVVSLNNKK
jgi:serine/threonine protein kinase